MQRQTFGYRRSGFIWGVAFSVIWAIGWLSSVLSAWSKPSVTINGVPGTPEQAAQFMWFALTIGIVFAGLDVFGILYCWNTRVEVADGELTWFDFLGRQQGRGSVQSAKILPFERYAVSKQKIKIQTDGGTFSLFVGQVKNYGLLKAILEGREVAPPEAKPVPIETLHTFGYRWTYLHFFSCFLIAVIIVMAMGVIYVDQRPHIIPVLGVSGLFLTVGVWMLLKSWNEKIQIGPNGIAWTDFLGRLKLTARPNQILDVSEVNSRDSRSFQIFTTNGTIYVWSYIKNYAKLKTEVETLRSPPIA